MSTKLFSCVIGLVGLGCASPWKISGGPQECVSMCKGWGMELAGMVGVGDQSPSGGGATACVCELPGKDGAPTGSAGIAAGSAAAIVAIQEEEQRNREQRQQAAK